MTSLKRVYLWRTAVTVSAAMELARARPDLLVDIGFVPIPVPLSAPVKIETSGVWPGREEELAEEHVHDGSIATIWAGPEEARTGWVQFTLEEPHRIVGVRIDEGPYARIRKFSIEALKDGDWIELASGTTIGSMKSLFFEAQEAQVFRLQILEAVETPVIAEFDLLTD
ncbi:MAG TPA: discoidin domain-containing protein [Planctomycetes bacterium]|nr:discoidin domain-containing protein [Planctomycetota bacterium]